MGKGTNKSGVPITVKDRRGTRTIAPGAKDNPPKYQVSIWYDSVFADKDDLFDAGLILNLNDYLPNADCEKAADGAVGAELCLADTNGDCKVNLTDLVQIKSEFLRNDCPNCQN